MLLRGHILERYSGGIPIVSQSSKGRPIDQQVDNTFFGCNKSFKTQLCTGQMWPVKQASCETDRWP